MSFIDRLTERAVRQRLGAIRHGRLTLRHGGVSHQYGGGEDPQATMEIHHPAFFVGDITCALQLIRLPGDQHLMFADHMLRVIFGGRRLVVVIRLST